MATTNYLDKTGLGLLWNKIKNLIVKPDWSENDPTDPAYIQNRTHYRTSLGYSCSVDCSEIIKATYESEDTFPGINKTYTYYCDDSIELKGFYPDAFPTGSVNDIDVAATTTTAMIDGIQRNLTCVYYESLQDCGNDCYFIYDNDIVITISYGWLNIFHNFEVVPTSVIVNVPTSTEVFEYTQKLNSGYLDGSLIESGRGARSEVFNGSDGKLAFGDYSHVEGYGEINYIYTYQMLLTGDANATTYTYTFYDALSEEDARFIYQSYDQPLFSYPDGLQLDVVVKDITDTTITLSRTLDAENALEGAEYYLGYTSMVASGNNSHAEGSNTTALGISSHAEGDTTTASGDSSHAEGHGTTALGISSHAEGDTTTASGLISHAEGYSTTASGIYSHAEGFSTTASNNYAHAEGNNTTSSGFSSHAEGGNTTASGYYSHAEGNGTTANSRSQHVFGEYNVLGTGAPATKGTYVEIVGNGTSYTKRSNARTLDWSGNEVLAGKLTVGAAPTADMDVATKKYVDDSIPDTSNFVPSSVTYSSGNTTTISSTSDSSSSQFRVSTSRSGSAQSGSFILSTGNSGTSATIVANRGLSIIPATASAGLTLTSNKITGLATPTSDTDSANKKYVDDQIAGITIPTNVSTFTNDAGYITLSDLPIYNGEVV